jgi:hypothetical protein
MEATEENHPTLAALPAECLSLCLTFVDPPSLGRAAAVNRAFRCEADSEAVWAAVYWAAWPSWTLLEPVDNDVDDPARFRQRSARRHSGALELRARSGVHVLEGQAIDDFDGNVTPLSATLGLDRGRVAALVQTGRGSLHNTPAEGVWVGELLSTEAKTHRGKNAQAEVSWRERLPTERGAWVYSGRFDDDGRTIRGTLHLSLMPRKRGTFWLRVQDPGAGAPPTPTMAQLCARIARSGGLRAARPPA